MLFDWCMIANKRSEPDTICGIRRRDLERGARAYLQARLDRTRGLPRDGTVLWMPLGNTVLDDWPGASRGLMAMNVSVDQRDNDVMVRWEVELLGSVSWYAQQTGAPVWFYVGAPQTCSISMAMLWFSQLVKDGVHGVVFDSAGAVTPRTREACLMAWARALGLAVWVESTSRVGSYAGEGSCVLADFSAEHEKNFRARHEDSSRTLYHQPTPGYPVLAVMSRRDTQRMLELRGRGFGIGWNFYALAEPTGERTWMTPELASRLVADRGEAAGGGVVAL